MKTPILALALVLLASLSASAVTVVRSPQRAEVSSYCSLSWKQVRYVPALNTLVASVTFTNEDYVSCDEPRRDRRVDFVLPGVRFDKATGQFLVKTSAGQRPVAVLKNRFVGVELLPAAKICVVRAGGAVQVELVCFDHDMPGARWIESSSERQLRL